MTASALVCVRFEFGFEFEFVGGEFSDVCRNMSFDFDLVINHKIKYYIVE